MDSLRLGRQINISFAVAFVSVGIVGLSAPDQAIADEPQRLPPVEVVGKRETYYFIYPPPAPDMGPGSGGGGNAAGPGGAPPGAPPGGGERPTPPSDNSNSEDCGNPTTQNPVIIATGEKLQRETDFVSYGLYGLSQRRTYRSSSIGAGMFGPYWWSSLAYPRLATWGCIKTPDWGCVPSTVQFWKPDGTSDIYRYVPGTESPYQYSVSGSASGGTLIYYPGLLWRLTRDRQRLTYSAAG